jgi:SAM-dependent methyltransferase
MSATNTWLERWDAQQETYMPDREERFEVMVDLLEMTAGQRPRVLDLACGPASLSARVLARLPEATVVGVDADPVLLTLARESAPTGLQLVDADLRHPDWPRRIPAGPYDAVLSTTALHWLRPAALRAVYAACARLLRPGGLLANGDHLRVLASPRLDALARELDRRRTARHRGDGENWRGWWDAVRADADLSDASGGSSTTPRRPRPASPSTNRRSGRPGSAKSESCGERALTPSSRPCADRASSFFWRPDERMRVYGSS